MQIFFHIVSVFANQTCASKETLLEFCAPFASHCSQPSNVLLLLVQHLGPWLSGHGGDGLVVELDDLRGLFQHL